MWKSKKIIDIVSDEYSYTFGYFTANKWLDDDTITLVRFRKDGTSNRELVKYSISRNEETVIHEDESIDWVVYKNKIYCNNGFSIIEIDADTNKKRHLYTNEYTSNCKKEDKVQGENNRMNGIHITGDGNFVSVYIIKDNLYSIFKRVNTQTGESEDFFEISFSKPFNIANHLMPCPADNNLYFFAHEGTTEYIPNRLWLYDIESKQAWNIAKQRMDKDGNVGDCFGHEMWAKNGKGMYFVHYGCSPLKPSGIEYVDVKTGKNELKYSKFNYWHVSTSADGGFLASDTQTGKDYSEVIAIDKSDNSETLIDSPLTTWVHPCHPHPQFSPMNKHLVYHALNKEANTCYVKIAVRENPQEQ